MFSVCNQTIISLYHLKSTHPTVRIITAIMSAPLMHLSPVHTAICFILLVAFATVLFVGTICLLIGLVYLLQVAVSAPEDEQTEADLERGKLVLLRAIKIPTHALQENQNAQPRTKRPLAESH